MKLDKYKKIGIISLIIVISGIFGWVYEFIFYYFNGGMKGFTWRGGNFLPWINIYAIGAILILITTKKYKKKPACQCKGHKRHSKIQKIPWRRV